MLKINSFFSEATPVKVEATKPNDRDRGRGRGRGRGDGKHGRNKGNIIQVRPIYTKCSSIICSINHDNVIFTYFIL